MEPPQALVKAAFNFPIFDAKVDYVHSLPVAPAFENEDAKIVSNSPITS